MDKVTSAERIELGNSGCWIEPTLDPTVWWAYRKNGAAWFQIKYFKEEDAQELSAALNGMQPDVTGDDEAVCQQFYNAIGRPVPMDEMVQLIARHRQSAVKAALRERDAIQLEQDKEANLLKQWWTLDEPASNRSNTRLSKRFSANHNAKQAAKIEDGKTYLLYDHFRRAFWGPNNGDEAV